ncbi:MAG: DoxX family protein [Cytophagales bacterium]|nr:DoxX family protein [Cytophagales bacterium]
MKDLLQRLNRWLDRFAAYAPLPIRLLLGGHLVYGVQDNVLSYAQMLEFRDFLLHHGFPVPLLSAHVSVYVQLLSGICYLAGLFTRVAAGLMIVNFLVALLMVHTGGPYAAAFPALAMLGGAIFLLLNGPGRPSLDHRLGLE